METKKTDARILKTKRRLANALATLLEDKTMDEITVIEICEKADINRMTFYKHYSDKYELLSDSTSLIGDYIYESLDKAEGIADDPAKYCIELINIIIGICEEKKGFIRRLSLENNALAASIISDSLQAGVEKILIKFKRHKKNRMPNRYTAAFLTGGASRMIMTWLPNRDSYPKEQLIKDITPYIVSLMGDG